MSVKNDCLVPENEECLLMEKALTARTFFMKLLLTFPFCVGRNKRISIGLGLMGSSIQASIIRKLFFVAACASSRICPDQYGPSLGSYVSRIIHILMVIGGVFQTVCEGGWDFWEEKIRDCPCQI